MKNIDKTIFLSKNENNQPIYINSIIFCAAATYFNKINDWAKYKQETIADKFINCFSDNDNVLKYGYTVAMDKNPIGLNKLYINYQGKNLVDNYYFEYDHDEYQMGKVAQKIAGNYHEI